MRIAALILALASLMTAPALAGLVDPSLIPDGDYTVTVEKIVDSKHVIVKMDNGLESNLPAAKSMTFDTNFKAAKAKIFVYKGTVITFAKA